jgi:hypothetical protein
MVHTILYLGRYSLNFERLRSHTGAVATFVRHDESGAEWPIEAPSLKVDGIVFGYMERGKEGLHTEDAFFAVAVGDIVLRNPIKLGRTRHTDGKGFGPSASQFGEASAQVLLEDIIQANPGQAAELQEIHRSFFSAS